LSRLPSHDGFEILKVLPSSTGHINILVKEAIGERDGNDEKKRKDSMSTKMSVSSLVSTTKKSETKDKEVDSPKHKFTVSMVPASFDKKAYELYKEYQRVVHSDDHNTPSSYTNFLCSSPLTSAPRTGPVLPESEDARYAPLIASARASTRLSWKNGEGSGAGLPLLSPVAEGRSEPINREVEVEEDPTLRFDFNPALDGSDLRHGYGSFHLHYKIDGSLVAVGVVDVLPLCLSSVYLYYNPHLPKLELGKLTALYEIQWVQQANKIAPRFQYWYAGLYVHSCPKMLYKRQFEPSELLCPISRQWVFFSKSVIDKLDKEKVPLLSTADEESKAESAEEVKGIIDACLKRTEMATKIEAVSAAACSVKIPLLISNYNGMWEPTVWRDLALKLNIPEGSRDSIKQEGQKALFALSERIGPDLMKRVIVSPSFLRTRR